jgi:two-component system, NtrC family, sensor histidine kinase HydH
VAIGLIRLQARRAELERQRAHERRLASLGEMSAVLAHEIRNPLASLKGNAQLLARGLPEDERGRAKAQRVVDEAVRLEALVNHLLEFVRTGAIERAPTDPGALLRDAAAAVDPERIDVDADGAPATWPLDGARIRQVLTNLLANAVQAGSGRVAAAVARRDGRLAFTVRDRGDGIPDEDLARIFEPFFTRRTQGTGLGLAVCKRIVEQHGGTLTAANAPGGGAVFTVLLPGA